MKKTKQSSAHDAAVDVDFDQLLHPALAFDHPRDVVADPDLTLNEKRSILAAWASDACAVEAAPALRQAPGTQRTVQIDEILESLRALDLHANALRNDVASYRRLVRRQEIETFRSCRQVDDAGGGRGPPH